MKQRKVNRILVLSKEVKMILKKLSDIKNHGLKDLDI